MGIWLDAEFVSALDAARAKSAVSRSQFFRSAVAEALQKSGVAIDQRKTVAPDRTGKGGRRRADDSDSAKANPRRSQKTPLPT